MRRRSTGWWLPALTLPLSTALATGCVTRSSDAPLRRSGFAFMSAQTQGMQGDDSLNPGVLWVKEGEAMWRQPQGPTARDCAACHADASTSMRGVAARYPTLDPVEKRPVNLAQRINLCRVRHQQSTPLESESQSLLAITAYVAMQSRGLPIVEVANAELISHRTHGRELFQQRMGQLDLSCSSCHDRAQGQRLGGSLIPPADSAPYPAYRLEWQGLGSLQRRIRNCLVGVRAEPFGYGSIEMIELELYLAERAKGLPLEAPGVRP